MSNIMLFSHSNGLQSSFSLSLNPTDSVRTRNRTHFNYRTHVDCAARSPAAALRVFGCASNALAEAVTLMNGNRVYHIGFPDSFHFDACAKARLAHDTSRALRMPWLFSLTAEQGRAAARKEAAHLGADSACMLTRCDELEHDATRFELAANAPRARVLTAVVHNALREDAELYAADRALCAALRRMGICLVDATGWLY